ncbi:MAG TPA: SpaA isopeptide-forming pilin-related protein [Acidimicrobiales bacterium]|nr:SpaA isopeptide-forming pilin-related protein [Acidimicrobiales bacterium]
MTIPATDTTRSRPQRQERARRVGAVAGILVTVALCVLVARSTDASADAGFGSGRHDVTTDGFTHPWLGGYATDVGTAWCIESGQAYPRASGNTRASDLPAERGVSATDRNALAYAVWAYTATGDATTAAGLAAVVHGLSGDDYASVNVPSMIISDPAVKAAAVAIYREAESREFWVSDPAANPWRITTVLTHTTGLDWDALTTVQTAAGRPVSGHRVGLVPYGVTDAPATEHVFTTDGAGQIHSHWTLTDPSRPIAVDAQTTAPTRYRVWKGPDYPAGSVPQRIITSGGTIYRGHAQQDLPSGRIELHKSTDNPAYQSAVGATFDVIARGVSTSLGTLTVAPDGDSETLELPVGDYVVTETAAPAGVAVDTTPYPVTVTEDATATLTLTDPVHRRAGLSLVKVDVVTQKPVAGAELLVERDGDGDGSYETTVGSFTTSLAPTSLDSLAAGAFRITETAAPDGYELPADTMQDVSIGWDQTAAVTFADHRSVAVTTESRLVDDGPDLPAPPAGLDDSAHVVASVGSALRDTVSISGLAPGEPATVSVALYGPTPPDEAVSCDADNRVYTDSWATTGSGDSASAEYTPTSIGRYTWVATVEVPGFGTVAGPCGEISESAILTPTIDTAAQAPVTTPGAPVTDKISVTGLADAAAATVHTALYGPFASVDAIADRCAVGDLGDPVGVVHDEIVADGTGPTSPSEVSSSPIALPTDEVGGWYTFVSILDVAGFPPVTHDCGADAETFHVVAPVTTTTTSTTTPAATTSSTTTSPPATTAPTSTAPATTAPPDTTAPPEAPVPPETPVPTTVPSTTTPAATTTAPSRTTLPPPPTTSPTTTSVPSSTSTTTTTTPSTSSTSSLPPTSTPSTMEPLPTDVGHPAAAGRGSSGVGSGELPRTGAAVGRLTAFGSALVLLGAAVGLLVARRRINVDS